MAQEISFNASLQFTKGSVATKSLTVNGKADMAGVDCMQATQTIPTTAGGTAIKLGPLAAAGWYLIKNNDSTNDVQLLSAVSGTVLNRAKAGECMMGRFDAGITAPALLALVGPVAVEYLIIAP